MTNLATALHDRGHLRHDVAVDDARDTLWYLVIDQLRSGRSPPIRPIVAATLTATL